MDRQPCVFELADSYTRLLAWFGSGIPGPYLKPALKLHTDTESVLRKLTESRLTGVELARCAKDKYRDTLSQERAVYPPA